MKERTLLDLIYYKLNSNDLMRILCLNIKAQYFSIKLKLSCSQNKPIQCEIGKALAVLLLINFNAERDYRPTDHRKK